MQLNVSISIPLVMAVKLMYKVPQVYVESYVTKLLPAMTGKLYSRRRHLFAQSTKSIIKMLSALGLSQINLVISIPGSG